MASLSLPSIHEMFPDHLMKSDFRRPRTSDSRSPDYDNSPALPLNRFHQRLPSFPALPLKSGEPAPKLGTHDHSGPFSRGPSFQDNHRHNPSSEIIAEISLRPSSTSPFSKPCCSHPHIKPPGFRSEGHSPHPQDASYRTRGLLSSDTIHPQLSNRSYANGDNNLEDYGCPVGNSTASIDGAFLVNNLDALGRKHVCPTCFKRFNRPSSLRIHLNTHTGATPFKCPWPKCGREFNVNSNMRRHYRNHLGTSRSQGHYPPASELRPLAPATIPRHAYSEGFYPLTNDHSETMILQRRLQQDREVAAPIAGVDKVALLNTPRTQNRGLNRPESSFSREAVIPDSDYQSQRKYAPMPSPPSSHSSFSDEEEKQVRPSSSFFRSRKSTTDMRPIGSREERYTGLYAASSHGSVSPSPSISQASSVASRTSSPVVMENRSSEQPKYNPSKPYSSSLSDARVRTTLRPAFV